MEHTPSRLGGLLVALVTPFATDGSVDHAALARLVQRQAADGADGFVACGSTGEAAALTEAERAAVLRTTVQAAGGRPMVMGVGGSNLAAVRNELLALAGHGADAFLIAAPAYIRPSQAGLLAWFTALADAAPAPVVAYDIPYRTGSTLSLATLRAVAAHPNVVALKDCGGDMAKTRALIADGQLAVLAGEDGNILATLAEGGAGTIAACANVATDRFAAVVRHARAGDMAQARAAWQPLLPLIDALLAEPNPAVVKGVLAAQGAMRAELRAPMQAGSAAAVEAALALLEL